MSLIIKIQVIDIIIRSCRVRTTHQPHFWRRNCCCAVGVMSDPAAGGSMPSTYKRRRALLAYQRRHRRGAAGNTMTAADQLELENTIRDSILEILLNKSIPLWAW